MGRPLNKKYFGPPTTAGKEIKVRFFDGTNDKIGWIIKQLGTKKFRVTDGSVIKDCKLVPVDYTDINAEGEMSISVKNDAGTVVQVAKITGNLVVDETGGSIKWGFDDFNAAGTEGVAEMEEAGTDDSMTGDDQFEPNP